MPSTIRPTLESKRLAKAASDASAQSELYRQMADSIRKVFGYDDSTVDEEVARLRRLQDEMMEASYEFSAQSVAARFAR